MKLVQSVSDVREEVAQARRAAKRIGLVPTMGSLHEGHLSLVDRCSQLTDFIVLSIYVNPLQFGPGEDFERYPRALERDLALAQGRGVHLVFAPTDREMYPREQVVSVTPTRLADRLCGLTRPGHFEGVLTVVSKLFGIVQPDVAVFGQKDFQQAVLIQKMAEDLQIPAQIEVAFTVRDPDGLAMSSRNEYLTVDERERATRVARALAEAVASFRSGRRSAEALKDRIRRRLEAGGGVDVEYVEIVRADDLEPVSEAGDEAVVAVAARVGATRLIDNVKLARPDPGIERLL